MRLWYKSSEESFWTDKASSSIKTANISHWYVICTGITVFAPVLHFLHWCYTWTALLSANQNRVTFSFTTVFVDTRLWKTKHPRKRFQNFRQSYVLSTFTNHSPLAWHKEGQKVTLVVVIGVFRSDLSITRKTDGHFGNVSAGVLFSKVAYQRKRW